MNNLKTVGDFMVREPVCAYLWQPVSFIRQLMLKYSFTYLPVCSDNGGKQCWSLVSDYNVALYLGRNKKRKDRLAKTLDSAIKEGLALDQVNTCFADESVVETLEKAKGKPVLVVDKEHPERLVGIVTPFDLL